MGTLSNVTRSYDQSWGKSRTSRTRPSATTRTTRRDYPRSVSGWLPRRRQRSRSADRPGRRTRPRLPPSTTTARTSSSTATTTTTSVTPRRPPTATPTSPQGIRESSSGRVERASSRCRTATKSRTCSRHADTFGVLQLSLQPTSHHWQFLPEPGQRQRHLHRRRRRAPARRAPTSPEPRSRWWRALTRSAAAAQIDQTATTVIRSSSPAKSSGLRVYRGSPPACATAAMSRSATRRRCDRPDAVTAATTWP